MILYKITKAYWNNEASIQQLVTKSETTIEEIIDNPDSFSEDVILSLERLLEKKELLLFKLANMEKQALIESPIVDLDSYRQFNEVI